MKEKKFIAEKKPKFDKSRCLKCQCHGIGCGGFSVNKRAADGHYVTVYCDYATITGNTCLRRGKRHSETKDMRGEDYYNCKLFKEGKVRR